MNLYQKIGIGCIWVLAILLITTMVMCEFFNGLEVMKKIAPVIIGVVILVYITVMTLDLCAE